MAAVPSPHGHPSFAGGPARAPQAAATEGLYERHSAKILSYCLHQLGSREEAEDAVQTTFMNAFRALGRGVVPEAESAWLFKIAENVCLSRRRSSWRRGRIESPSDFEVIEEIVPGPSRQRDELIGIEQALASMPEQQRRAILLREWQGLSYREISDELELSQSAVETLIFRARRSLAQGLERPDLVNKPKRKSFRRALHAVDLGTLVAAAKTLIAGGVAAKATVAAVAVTTAAATAAGVTPKLEGHSPQPFETTPAAVVQPRSATAAGARAPARYDAPLGPDRAASTGTPARVEPAARGAKLDRPLLSAPASAPAASAPVVVPGASAPEPAAVTPAEYPAPAAPAPAEPQAAASAPVSLPTPIASPTTPSPATAPVEPVKPSDRSEDKSKSNRRGRGNGKGRGEEPTPSAGTPATVGVPTPAPESSGEERIDRDRTRARLGISPAPAPEPTVVPTAPAPADTPAAPAVQQPSAPVVQQPAVEPTQQVSVTEAVAALFGLSLTK